MVWNPRGTKMAGQKIVIDASVAVKWYNPEKLSERALELRSKHVKGEVMLYAPDLLLYEVTNALRWNPELGDEDVRLAAQSLEDIMIVFEKPSFGLAVQLAYASGLTIYDASYLALARDLGCELVTADKTLLEKGEENVIPLGRGG